MGWVGRAAVKGAKDFKTMATTKGKMSLEQRAKLGDTFKKNDRLVTGIIRSCEKR